MARDYKSRAARKKARQHTPAWIWLVIGYVLGVLSVGLLWWSQASQQSQGASWIGAKPARIQPAAPVAVPEPDPEPEIEPPHFDFYSLLPELEVVVPEEELERKPVPPVSTEEVVAPEPVPKSGYLIQVSSFRSAKDADRLKAQLALLGLHAQVNKASIKGTAWYRVRVGPYNSAEAVQRTRKQLTNSGYKAMVIKVRP